MSVIINTPNLNKRQKFLTKDVDKTLLYVGEILRGNVIKAWLSGKNAKGRDLKKGNKQYLRWKSNVKHKKNRINFNLSGDMQLNFKARKTKKNEVTLGFTSARELKKARWNYDIRKNMFILGRKVRNKMTTLFFKRMIR